MLGMNATTGLALSDMAHLRQSIAIILSTPVGSRVMRREFGSLLPFLVDAPQNPATRQRLFAAVVIALMRWEPRLSIRQISITTPAPGQSEVVLQGVYIPPDSPAQPVALTLPLQATA